jgi:hypothetical protein
MAKAVIKKAAKKKTSQKKATKQAATEAIPSRQTDGIISIVENKGLKTKEKVVLISDSLLNNKASIDELVETAASQKEVIKGTLIEAIEFASKSKPELINKKVFEYVVQSLKDNAPRVKWEAARVISNTAHLFPKLLKEAVVNLLANTEHSGTVVRWSAATALSKIISLNTPLNKELIPAAEAILKREQDTAIKEIYEKTVKKAKNFASLT